MSKGNVDKFLDLMQKDEGLARKMAARLYKLETSGGDFKKPGSFVEKEVVPLAKEYDLEFTVQDFLAYTEEATAKKGLTTADLSEVSGGKGGVRAALMGTLALLGVAAAPAAMEMVSDGEVSPFSMVASAEGVDLDDDSFDSIINGVLGKANDVLSRQDATIDEIEKQISAIDELLKDFSMSNDEKVNSRKAELEEKKAELEKKAAQSLANNMKAKIDNVATELGKVKPETKTELETKLEEALNQAKPAHEALSAALEGDDAKKISDALANARTQYDAFTGAIKNYLKGLKTEVEEALKTEANESRQYLVEIKKELQADTSGDKNIDEQLKKGELNWIQYIRLGLANIKTVKASYDKLDELKNLIDKVKNQLGENSPIINEAKEQERQLRNSLNAETHTSGLAKGCEEPDEKKINKLKAAVEEALNEAKTKLAKAIIAANDLGGQALEDAKKLQKELETALKGTDAKAITDAVDKIKKTIEALNKAKLAELPTKASTILQELNDKLNVLENMAKMQNRTDTQKNINELRNRIKKIGKVTNKNAAKKAKELENIKNEIQSLFDVVYDFEENLSTHVAKPKKNIGEMLKFYKNEATHAKDQAAVKEIKQLEREIAEMPDRPSTVLELSTLATRIGNIKASIPQIKALLNKATTLKKIAEQINADLANVLDGIIKEIEAADSVEKIKTAEIKIDNAEKTLRGLMRTKINEANETAHTIHKTAETLGLDQLKDNFVKLIDTFDSFNYEGASVDELYEVYTNTDIVDAAKENLISYLGKQIDDLVNDANVLKYRANGVDNQLYNNFNVTATNLAKETLLNNLEYAAKTITSAREKLVEFQDELVQKQALKTKIAALKEQATKLKEIATGEDNTLAGNFNNFIERLDNLNLSENLEQITTDFNQVKNLVNERAKEFVLRINYPKAIPDAGTLLKIADNTKTAVNNYGGFGGFDMTAGTQANILVTFLKNKINIVDDLKFVDKKTRAKLAKDIKHIFDQIGINQETGKYDLQGKFFKANVAHSDLKLICEAYDVVAEDFGTRLVYRSPKEGKGLTFKDHADVLAQALSKVQRLDLLDVSPESRAALNEDIREIGAKIKSTPGWIYGQTLSLEGADKQETKNMQDGLARILEFYNYLNV